MNNIRWIKELVLAEQQMEESGVVDMSAGFDPESSLNIETIEFLKEIKNSFIEAAAAFNQLKGSTVGTIKIYGISKTDADFMLFRNGFKLIFSKKEPGLIYIYRNQIGTQFGAGTPPSELRSSVGPAEVLKAEWGAFGDLQWTANGKSVRLDYMVRYYVSQFVKESTK